MEPSAVWTEYHGYVVDTVHGRLHGVTRDAVEDAASEAFVAMLKRWSTLTPDGVRNYWWTATWRKAVTTSRRERRYHVWVEPAFDDPTRLDELERQTVIFDPEISEQELVLEQLTPRQQQVIVLKALGYSRAEISAALGISLHGVGRLKDAARRRYLGLPARAR